MMTNRTLLFACTTAFLFAGCTGAQNSAGLDLDGVLDNDGDALPDALEQTLCARQLVNEVVGQTGGVAGYCASKTDYRLPRIDTADLPADIFVPTGVILGTDADGDALPATIDLSGYTLRVSTADGKTTVEMTESTLWAGPVGLDLWDNDPQMPVVSVIETSPAQVPLAVTHGDDRDGDLFPDLIYLEVASLRVDRRDVSVEAYDFMTLEVPLDAYPIGDDSNPETPVISTVPLPAVLPTGVKLGPDVDMDLLPTHLVLELSAMKFNKNTQAVTFHSAEGHLVPLDSPDLIGDERGNDNDPDQPVISRIGPVPLPVWAAVDVDDATTAYVSLTFQPLTVDKRTRSSGGPLLWGERYTETVEVPAGALVDQVLNVIDLDRDLIPDAVEPIVCDVEDSEMEADGRCEGDDYFPPELGTIGLGLVDPPDAMVGDAMKGAGGVAGQETSNDAPGPASVLLVTGLIALAGAARRR